MGALIASIYIVLTAINPIGYGAIQLRVSAIISILPFFKREYKIPCIAGVVIANCFSPLGIIDVIFGIALWLIAYYIIDKLINNIFIKCAITAILSGLLIGLELTIVLGIPFIFNVVSITISQSIVFLVAIIVFKKMFKAKAL